MNSNKRPYLTLIFLLLIMPFLHSQNENCPIEGRTLQMDNACSNVSKQYKARDKITFTEGYKFNTTNGVMKAKLEETLIVPISNENINNNVINLEERELITSKEVGSIHGTFDVSMIGAAAYSIPLKLPIGMNGVTPNLSINYNSNLGDGALGLGWYIGGVSSIQRVSKNIAYDQIISPIMFDNNDAFEIDGTRLVKLSNTEYIKMENDLSKITPQYENNQIVSFTLITKEGINYEYGVTENAREKINLNNNSIINYHINKITDLHGNSIIFYYDNTVQGRHLLNRVLYTENQTLGKQAFNEVLFIYDQREDSKWMPKYYIPGIENKQNSVLLTKITIKADGERKKSYKLAYNNDYKLVELTELTQDNKSYNSTLFKWGGEEMSYEFIDKDFEITNFTPGYSIPSILQDHHLSKRIDYRIGRKINNPSFYNDPIQNPQGVTWYRHYVDFGDANGIWIDLPTTYDPNTTLQQPIWYKNFSPANSADFTGDGIDDIVIIKKTKATNNTYVAEFIVVKTKIQYTQQYGNTVKNYSFEKINTSYIESYTSSENNFQIAILDLNSDGLADMIIYDRQDRKLLIRYSQRDINTGNIQPFIELFDISNSFPTTSFPPDIFSDISFADFNGDGIVDIIINSLFGKSYIYIGQSQKGSFSMTTLNLGFNISKPLVYADFNNDGKTDIYSPHKGKFYFSKGDASFVEKNFTLPMPANKTLDFSKLEHMVSGDFNGDGNTDIAYVFPVFEITQTYDGHTLETTKTSRTIFIYNEGFELGHFKLNVLNNQFEYCDDPYDSNPPITKKIEYDYSKTQNNVTTTKSGSILTMNTFKDNTGIDQIKYILYNYDNSYCKSGTKEIKWYYSAAEINTNNRTYSNKITEISDGLNNHTKISYFDSPADKSNVTETYPVTKIAPNIPCVHKLHFKNSVNNDWTTQIFEYKNGKTHVLGKGFLGYSEISIYQNVSEDHSSSTTDYCFSPLNSRTKL